MTKCKTINRIQSFQQTKSVVDAVRARGVHSVNCDILYGLPFQTCETLKKTVGQIVSQSGPGGAFRLCPCAVDEKHQSLIPEDALPDIAERYRQMTMAGEMLKQAGYRAVGIDHFAKPADTLCQAVEAGALRRNFQGYTTDTADALIGLGASSVGRLPQGYVQNMVATGKYQRMVGEGGLAAVKGIELSQDDHLRSHVIERLMCDFSIDLSDMQHRFGKVSHSVRDQAQQFAAGDRDGVVRLDADVLP